MDILSALAGFAFALFLVAAAWVLVLWRRRARLAARRRRVHAMFVDWAGRVVGVVLTAILGGLAQKMDQE